MILADVVKNLQTFIRNLNCLKVHSLISVQHKRMKLGQIIHLNVMWLKFETRPKLLRNLKMVTEILVTPRGIWFCQNSVQRYLEHKKEIESEFKMFDSFVVRFISI